MGGGRWLIKIVMGGRWMWFVCILGVKLSGRLISQVK
uniref:Uncharacterized protein n=1 Tax=Kalanchoe fedtschenkoi TaxID=63787 RepID=A0A7N1A0Q3_KALFE